MIKRGLLALVFSLGLLPPTVDDCKHKKQQSNIVPHEVLIKSISTPEQVENYLLNSLSYEYDIINYGQDDYVASFKVINERKKDDCDGGALAAAALLSDDGYKPLMLIMGRYYKEENSWSGHAIFIYEKNGLMGCLGISKTDCLSPRFKSLEEITMHFRFDEYKLVNLDDVAPDWKDCEYNLRDAVRYTGEFKKVQ